MEEVLSWSHHEEDIDNLFPEDGIFIDEFEGNNYGMEGTI
jgi:hypothetical protein